MRSTLMRRVARLLGMSACTFLVAGSTSTLMATPALADSAYVSIGESVIFSDIGFIKYELNIIDSSQTMTEEACRSLPQSKASAETTFSNDNNQSYCRISATIVGNNPYLAINKQGDFTFAARPVAPEDLHLSFPADTDIKGTRSITFSAPNAAVTQLSSGGSIDDGFNHWVIVKWSGDALNAPVAAIGTLKVPSNFHPIVRMERAGISPVDVPSDLTTVNQATSAPSKAASRRATSSQNSNSTPDVISFFDTVLSSLQKYGGLPIAIIFIAIVWGFDSLKKKKKKKKQKKAEPSPLSVPQYYEPARPPAQPSSENLFDVSSQPVTEAEASTALPHPEPSPSPTPLGRNPFSLEPASSTPDIPSIPEAASAAEAADDPFRPSSSTQGGTSSNKASEGRNRFAPPEE
ncbi:MAG: hypothetical protein E7E13_02230 [Actinomyces sp.]|uniref:hypothetical protein n=1 Tax=Actinomyces sp. TaxID=29317 RepID=UPI0028FE6578|nr:hypothetical protein [Actinomyces sp.]MDU2259031.1 hypothetical protein [Actinomyces sp.]